MPPPRLRPPAGEQFVWFTGMGLTVGLAMVALLLLVIVVQGLSSFWPRAVDLITLKPGSPGLAGSSVLAGEILVERDKRAIGNEEVQREIQVFVGNKDAYQLGFHWIDVADIVSRERPKDLILVERMEYGDAIGTPLRLILADGTELPAMDAEFDATLGRLIDEANARRSEILDIEKVRIGAINRRLDDLRIAARADGRDTTGDPEIERLQSEYGQLATKAKELRGRQDVEKLVIRLATGGETIIPTGMMLHRYYPNQLGFFGRFGLFVHNATLFLWDNPREANTEGGIFPAIFGTFVMTLLMSLAVVPFGVVAAIYLREYARQGPLVRAVRIAVNNLAGVPSIVFGVFGLGFFIYLVGGNIDRWFFDDRLPTPTFGTGGILWASLTLALMTVPVVIVATEEAIAAVPRGAKEGSLAMGASKWQTIQRIVLPASAPGILTGLILAMARGAGEVAPLMLGGVVKLAPSLPMDSTWNSTDVIPFVHLDQKFMHLGFHIYDLGFQSPDSDAAKPMVFATTLLLIVLVVMLNIAAILIREHLRRKYKASTF